MKKVNPEDFRKGAKELERQASVVREAISIIESVKVKRAKRRSKKAVASKK